jgi:hypothetical protein
VACISENISMVVIIENALVGRPFLAAAVFQAAVVPVGGLPECRPQPRMAALQGEEYANGSADTVH